MNDDIQFKIDIQYGRFVSESRYVPCGEWLVSESRVLRYDRDGVLTEVTPWKPLSRIYFAPDTPAPPRPWWRFW
jgi:hypothetical protein